MINILNTNFDVLDFMWFLFRFIALGTGILFFFFLGLSAIGGYIRGCQSRKREKELENALMNAIQKGDFSVEAKEKEK